MYGASAISWACPPRQTPSPIDEVAAAANRARQFTDTASFTLRCLVCQKGLCGEKDALAHAKETGHANFAEYK